MNMLAAPDPERYLLLARHGRTFDPGQTAVWLGREQDDALSAVGAEDAIALGEGLAATGVALAFARVSPQLRARQTLELAGRALRQRQGALISEPLLTLVDEHLSELSFGRWTGCSHMELLADGKGEAVRAWQEKRLWPQDAGFAPEEETLFDQARANLGMCHRQLGEIRTRTCAAGLVVSHGARLRFVLASLNHPDGPSAPNDKLGCGRLGVLRRENTSFRPIAWNIEPKDLAAVLHLQA